MTYIETNHVTAENRELFGMTFEQRIMINELLFQCPDNVHGYVLEKLYRDGMSNIIYKMTTTNAEKLIKILYDLVINPKDVKGIPFQFVEYNTPEWHVWKNDKRNSKLTKNVNYENRNR